ncbi:hypothetical protein [Streptomyces xanthochromogenes]|uniref:hypothetical protein n=1 Tax=Streptomyces xanthochromogenes TaxID=67384 RepID=UPI002F4127B4
MDDAVGGTAVQDSSDATPAREELRSCTYCLEPGADCCVAETSRASGSPDPVYAHRRCAARKGVKPLYLLITAAPVTFPWA